MYEHLALKHLLLYELEEIAGQSRRDGKNAQAANIEAVAQSLEVAPKKNKHFVVRYEQQGEARESSLPTEMFRLYQRGDTPKALAKEGRQDAGEANHTNAQKWIQETLGFEVPRVLREAGASEFAQPVGFVPYGQIVLVLGILGLGLGVQDIFGSSLLLVLLATQALLAWRIQAKPWGLWGTLAPLIALFFTPPVGLGLEGRWIFLLALSCVLGLWVESQQSRSLTGLAGFVGGILTAIFAPAEALAGASLLVFGPLFIMALLQRRGLGLQVAALLNLPFLLGVAGANLGVPKVSVVMSNSLPVHGGAAVAGWLLSLFLFGAYGISGRHRFVTPLVHGAFVLLYFGTRPFFTGWKALDLAYLVSLLGTLSLKTEEQFLSLSWLTRLAPGLGIISGHGFWFLLR